MIHVHCPMETKVMELGDLLMNLFDVMERMETKLNKLCSSIEDAHQHVTSLETRMEGLHEELENNSGDRQQDDRVQR